ncbi:MAG TPA: type III secretion system cytoplasmic ring protein SctQ [Pararobbsia sp.]|nr:type III secretion system cytoplasmic ring protein SctQ [Pararobbsia sp.]
MDATYLLALFERDIGTKQIATGGHALSDWHAHAVESLSEANWHVLIRTDHAWPFAIRAWSDDLLLWAGLQADTSRWCDALPMVVALSIGRSRVRRDLLKQVERGDLVLIHAVEWQARIGARVIGAFCLEEEGWELNLFDKEEPVTMRPQPHETIAPSGDDVDSGAPTRAGTGWLDSLPVEVEFVLDRLTLTVAELRSLAAGAVFPVRNTVIGIEAAKGRYAVQLCANGKWIGEGELVAIGDTLAVELIRFDLAE